MKESVLAAVDKAGSALSLGCAAHCAALPLFGAALPFLSSTDHFIDFFVFAFSLPLALTAIFLSRCGHRRRETTALFIIGGLFLACGFHFEEEFFGRLLLALGGICLASAHWLNFSLRRACTFSEVKTPSKC